MLYGIEQMRSISHWINRGGSDGPAALAMAGPHLAAEMGVALPIVSAHAYEV